MGKLTSSQIVKRQLDRRKPEIHLQSPSPFCASPPTGASCRQPHAHTRTVPPGSLATPSLGRAAGEKQIVFPKMGHPVSRKKTNQTKDPLENNVVVSQHINSEHFFIRLLDS